MDQTTVPAVFMRGGTSKGLFFKEADLPARPAERDRILLAALGSPDAYGRQLDGMGGGISSLSKAMIVGPSSRPGVDVDYTFGQVAVDLPRVDYKANCGNLSSAVGAFAVDEGLLPLPADTGTVLVRMYNTNTRKVVHCHVPLSGRKARVCGGLSIDGVTGTGAAIRLDFLDPGGSACRSLLPTGRPIDLLDAGEAGQIEVTIVDATNPVAFVNAGSVGLTATETAEQLRRDGRLLQRLERIRRAAAVLSGLATSLEDAAENWQSSPKIAVVAAPSDVRLPDGRALAATEVDLNVRMISMGLPHGAVPLTGAMCVAAAALIEGSLANAVARRRPSGSNDLVRVGHASGVLPVAASVRIAGGVFVAETASVFRTARRLMSGLVYVPAPSPSTGREP